MNKIVVLVLIVLFAGCTSNSVMYSIPSSTPYATLIPSATPEPTVSPMPEPTASPTPEPTASPAPEPTYSPSEIGAVIERGDFVITIESVGKYDYETPMGENVTDYRIDLSIKNRAASQQEYAFDFSLAFDGKRFPMRWFSSLFNQGVLSAGEVISGSLFFDVGSSRGPFEFLVRTRDLSVHDYLDVIGKNELSKSVVGVVNYADVCGENELALSYLGSLATADCGLISAARDWFNYPCWVEDGVVMTRLKVKNSRNEGVNLFVVDSIDPALGKARELAYTYEPVFLDDYTVGWFVHLGRNEIWKTDMNYTKYCDEAQISGLPAPVVIVLKSK